MAPNWLGRLVRSEADLDAEQLRDEIEVAGHTPVTACTRGSQVTVAGVLRSVTLRPRAGVPALEAELFDGTGAITLVWLGRRRITGIEPGRALTASGRVTEFDGHRALFNPRYALRASVA